MSMKSALLVALSAVHLTTVFSTDCDHNLDQCNALAWSTCHTLARSCTTPDYCRSEFVLCKAAENATVSAPSEVESSSSAYEIERSSSNPENFTNCENELKRCASDVWHCLPSKETCSLNVQHCFRSYDQCEAAEVESTPSVGESSSSASEVERSSSNSESFTDCKNELNRCALDVWDHCDPLKETCSLNVDDCFRSYDQCEAAEIDCDIEVKRCALDVWRCLLSKETCSLNDKDCFRSYDQCEAAKIVSTTSVGEASSSAAEVERSSSNPENFTGNCDPANPICYE